MFGSAGLSLTADQQLYPSNLNNRSKPLGDSSFSAAASSPALRVDLDWTVTSRDLLPNHRVRTGLQSEMKTLTDLTLSGAIGF